jgi:OFA family oxalate/formate antiporter-like MFS transporter
MGAPLTNRWVQLLAGICSLIAIANFQYAWTLFVMPLEQRHGWSRESIQVAYSVFLLAQTWLVPAECYLADRFGPRRLLIAGSALVAFAWTMNAQAESLPVLYAAQVLAGCGSGIVYGISMGNALKWFPDRRGLAAGLTAAAFGAGSAATVVPIQATIERDGYEAAFLWFGLGQALLVLLCGLLVRFPGPDELRLTWAPKVLQSSSDHTPREVIRSPVFWLLYAMMTVGAIPGLLMGGQMAPMAADFRVSKVEFVLMGQTITALSLALMLDRITGGLTRPVFGWISDRVGRERAMFAAFALEGSALFLLIQNPRDPSTFVLMSGLAFFGWGAIFSLFPATIGDLFGRKFATTNYGLLYTAKGMASLFILAGNHFQARSGSWVGVFAVMIAADWLAALLAIFCLRRLARRVA